MRFLEWRFTFRPFLVFKRAAIVAGLLSAAWLPVNRAESEAYQVRSVQALPDKETERVRKEIEPRLAKLEPHESEEVAEAIVEECARTGFDPLFVIALIEVESKFDVEAQSPTGARGLMQLVPKTFRLVSDAKRMLDPVENVRAGIRYLRRLADSGFKRPETVLLAYNQGPGVAVAVHRDGEEMPEEGAAYVPRVMSIYQKLLKKHGKKPTDARKLFLVAKMERP
jgi:soluble lytic murein transglycosylase-like protein